MINYNHLPVAASRFLLAAGIAGASLLAVALPSFAHAATYAYVNNASEVRTVVANDWQTAIATAFNISLHSGVLLLTSLNGNLVGNTVGGI